MIDDSHSQIQFESMKEEVLGECMSLLISLIENNDVSEQDLHLIFKMMTYETEAVSYTHLTLPTTPYV